MSVHTDSTTVRTWITVVAIMVVATGCAIAQSDTITANPNAVKLRRIWMVRGGTAGGERVGGGVGSIGDIDGDGLSEFAVHFGRLGQWRVYKGASPAPSTEHMWRLDSGSVEPPYPVVGDFWGTGHKAVGFGVFHPSIEFDQHFYFSLFRTESGSLPDTPSAVLDPYRTMAPAVIPGVHDMLVADLDGDGADELIVVVYRLFRNNVESSNAELWIYKGGPDFQLDTPTVIVRDPEANRDDDYTVSIGDVDGDHHPDLMTGGDYPSGIKLKLYYGISGSPWSWTTPDRVDTLTDAFYNIDAEFTLLDVDGDGKSDMLRSLTGSAKSGVYLFRSSLGAEIGNRSLLVDSADRRWLGYSDYKRGGYLNDSNRHYEMTLIAGLTLLWFGGGSAGPDHAFEAYYSAGGDTLTSGNVFGRGGPISDCNGDGWDDYITANSSWFGEDQGIAIVLAGGPYIPRDSATSGVRDIVVAGVQQAVSIWPNPALGELNIAWRGDLKRMPRRFAVHDVLGREIARGEVEPWRGAALWRCEGVPAGTYLLSMYDNADALITTVSFIKQ
jgi:hypothetical protein